MPMLVMSPGEGLASWQPPDFRESRSWISWARSSDSSDTASRPVLLCMTPDAIVTPGEVALDLGVRRVLACEWLEDRDGALVRGQGLWHPAGGLLHGREVVVALSGPSPDSGVTEWFLRSSGRMASDSLRLAAHLPCHRFRMGDVARGEICLCQATERLGVVAPSACKRSRSRRKNAWVL